MLYLRKIHTANYNDKRYANVNLMLRLKQNVIYYKNIMECKDTSNRILMYYFWTNYWQFISNIYVKGHVSPALFFLMQSGACYIFFSDEVKIF